MNQSTISAQEKPAVVAYREVSSALRWIYGIAETGDISDEYIRSLEPDSQKHGVMPVAELLMALLNPTEQNYAQRKLPQPTTASIINTLTLLLDRFEKSGLDGNPYLLIKDETSPPDFVDAANYLIGAVNGALSNRILASAIDKSLRDRCEQCLIECIHFLIDSQIQNPNGFERGGGWSWCSPKQIASQKALSALFPGRFPAQTYFTCQAMTSLMEILFENLDFAIKNKLADDILNAVARGKVFLLDTVKHPTRQGRAGWGDFTLKDGVSEEDLDLNIRTDGASSIETQGNAWQSLYALECLSYVNYYLSDIPTVARVRRIDPDIFAEFETFTPEHSEAISNTFGSVMNKIIGDKKMYQANAAVQVSNPLNLSSEKSDVADSIYVDGTVAYNALNALNFCSKYHSIDSADLKDWQTSESSIIDGILSHSFQGTTFQHTAIRGSDEFEMPAIYATRTAVAALLSWGVEPPDTNISEALDPEIANLVTRLFELTVGQPEAASSDVNLSTDPDAVICLVKFSMFSGLVCRSFDDSELWGDPTLAAHTDMVKTGAKWDRQDFIRANGQFAIEPFLKAFQGDIEGAKVAAERAISSPLLFNALRKALKHQIESGFNDWTTELKSLPKQLIESLTEVGGFVLEDRFIWR